jgi:hypothetical protein
MFLKDSLYAFLMAAGFLVASPSSSAPYEDTYLPLLYAEESVVGCTSQESFEMLFSGEPLMTIDGICGLYAVAENPTFIGWILYGEFDFTKSVKLLQSGPFLDSHESVDVSDADGIIARKYVMETEEGTIHFVWPSPLSMADYAFFVPSYEDEDEIKEAPAMDWHDEPVQFEGPEVLFASL